METAAREAFLSAGYGLTLDWFSLSTTKYGNILTVSGQRPDGTPFSIVTDPFQYSPIDKAREIAAHLLRDGLTERISQSADRLASANVIASALIEGQAAIKQVKRMATFAAVADRVAALKARQATEADKLMLILDEVEPELPRVAEMTNAFVNTVKADVSALEDGLRQLTNALPLDEPQNESTA